MALRDYGYSGTEHAAIAALEAENTRLAKLCITRDRRLKKLNGELARLQAIVDKLAKTANGVIVEPRMRLWYIVRTHPEPLWIDVAHAVDASHPGEPPDWCVWGRTQHEEAEMISLCICYSTYRAAEAAKEKP